MVQRARRDFTGSGRVFPNAVSLRCVSDPSRLDLLKALGDNTRYAIYLELARSPRPLATAEVADTLGLHPNTVRPHLERMREVGLLDARPEARSGVGRPQKLYEISAHSPSLGLEPPVYPMVARMLLDVVIDAGVDAEPALAAGRQQGRRLAHTPVASRGTCVEATVCVLDDLGFDPAAVVEDDVATVAFGHCPFADLAERHPEVVCSMHRGLIEGFVDELGGGEVVEFNDLSHRAACRTGIRNLCVDTPT